MASGMVDSESSRMPDGGYKWSHLHATSSSVRGLYTIGTGTQDDGQVIVLYRIANDVEGEDSAEKGHKKGVGISLTK
jgi:hypothetical protein